MGRVKILALVTSLALASCSIPREETASNEVLSSTGPTTAEQVVRICDDGWIILSNGERVFAPGGSKERWPIAPNSNEEQICHPKGASNVE